MKILVTGKNGQLGSEIQEISAAYPKFKFFFADYAELDITSLKALETYIDEHRIQAIINCAAYTAVDKAEDEAEAAEKVNVKGVENIDRLAQAKQLRYIHISTDYVFDGSKNTPYVESDPVNPIGVYGKTKRAGEEIVLNSPADAIVIRTSWVYSSFGANFVKTMLRLGLEREQLNVVFDQIGTPTYARDLAKVCLDVLDGYPQISQTGKLYHYSNEGVCSWYDFAASIMEFSGLSCKVFPIESKDYPTKAVRPAYSVLNKSRIKQDFKLEIPHWTVSLKNCLQQFKSA